MMDEKSLKAADASDVPALARVAISKVFADQVKIIEENAASKVEALGGDHARSRQFETMLDTIAELTHSWNSFLVKFAQSRIAHANLPPPLGDDFIVRGSGLVDVNWYRESYLDVAAAGVDPVRHYIEHGAKELRDPGPFFSTSAYLAYYPDIASAGVNPLAHYIEHGRLEGRKIEPSQSLRRTVESWVEKQLLDNTFIVPEDAAVVDNSQFSPLISIIMPIYNTPKGFLLAAIDSVISQSYRNWQLIIVDDGSPKRDCVALARSYCDKDSRIQLVSSDSNIGIALASQLGLQHSTGEYIAFLDHDDILTPAALSHVVGFLRKNRDIDMIYTNHGMLSDIGIPLEASLKPGWSPEFFLSTNYIIHFKVIKKTIIDAVNGFIDTIHISQDVALTLKLIEVGASIAHLPIITYYWRKHAESVSSGVSGKPKIKYTGLKTIQEFIDRRGLAIDVEWPPEFQRRSTGVYKLNFRRAIKPRAAIVVPVADSKFDVRRFLSALDRSMIGDVPVHLVTCSGLERNSIDVKLNTDCRAWTQHSSNQADFDNYVANIDAEILVFVTEHAFFPTDDWLIELLGYFAVSSEIGAVGGKVMDSTMRLRSGATLLLPGLPTMCDYFYDTQDGYWHNNLVATNVEAVSARLLALRQSDYLSGGGVPVFKYGDAAGLSFCLGLRALRKRVVFNPWAKIFSDSDPNTPADFEEQMAAQFGSELYSDRYYPSGLRRSALYSL